MKRRNKIQWALGTALILGGLFHSSAQGAISPEVKAAKLRRQCLIRRNSVDLRKNHMTKTIENIRLIFGRNVQDAVWFQFTLGSNGLIEKWTGVMNNELYSRLVPIDEAFQQADAVTDPNVRIALYQGIVEDYTTLSQDFQAAAQSFRETKTAALPCMKNGVPPASCPLP